MIISLYITDSDNKLIFQYLPDSKSPTFQEIWGKILSLCPELTEGHCKSELNKEDPFDTDNFSLFEKMKYTSHGSIAKHLEIYKLFSIKNKINYWTLCSSKLIIEPFVMMDQIDSLLLDYFSKNTLTLNKLTNNYDRISLILYSFFNDGELNVGKLSMNTIRDNVPVKQDLSKMLNSTANTIKRTIQNAQNNGISNTGNLGINRKYDQLVSTTNKEKIVPWRSADVKYVTDEIFIDVIENINVIYQRQHSIKYKGALKLVRGDIIGEIQIRSLIGENPMVELRFKNNKNLKMGLPIFHECVELPITYQNIPKFEYKTLKFVPPDGKFTLMRYDVDLDEDVTSSTRPLSLVTLDLQDDLGIKHDEFEVILNIENSRSITHIHNLKIELKFSANNKMIDNNNMTDLDTEMLESRQQGDSSDITEEKNEQEEENMRVFRCTNGRFESGIDGLSGTWILDHETSVGMIPVLHGWTNHKRGIKIESAYMTYEHGGVSASGLAIDAVDITQAAQTVFKGVKYQTNAVSFEIRA